MKPSRILSTIYPYQFCVAQNTSQGIIYYFICIFTSNRI